MKMKLDEAIERYKNNAEYERTHGNLQGCLEFRQLAEWLEKLQKIEQIIEVWHQDIYAKDFECISEVAEVVEDGNNT